MKSLLPLSLAVLVLVGFATEAPAQEWTRFRGPNGTGISQAKTIPTNLTVADINWKIEPPGVSHSSPVWVDGRLFCVSTSGELDVVEASEKFNVLHRFPLEELCHSTPAVAGGRLYVRTEKHLVSLGGEKLAPRP